MTASPSGALYLGFDFGTRRIGCAVGDGLTGAARPLPPVSNAREPDWTALKKLLNEWRPAGCVVGLPVDLDGNAQQITGLARTFAHDLGHRFAVPVYLCDERLSSRSADDELRSARADGRLARRIRKGDRDGVAARLVLEQWLALPPPSRIAVTA